MWLNFLKYDSLEIKSKLEGEIRFGPVFLILKSNPEIKEFNNKIFGDWFYKYNYKLYLQEWNSTLNPNTNLISINLINYEYQIIIENIKSVSWEMELRSNQLYFIDQYNKKEYLINES